MRNANDAQHLRDLIEEAPDNANHIRTRNQRLAALRTFFEYVVHRMLVRLSAVLRVGGRVLEMTPLDRFALDRGRVRYLPPNAANDELFFVEEDRTVRADNTFSFKSIRFEAPRHLPDRTIQIRFERRNPVQRVIVFYKGQRMGEAKPLDPVANDRKPVSESDRQNNNPPTR